MVSCLLILMLTACPIDRFIMVRINNNSNHNISFYIAERTDEPIYPDTTIALVRGHGIQQYINVDKNDSDSDTFESLDNLFEGRDTVCLFVFDTDTLKKYSWEEIQVGYKILKRYDLSKTDIRNLGLLISYPPDDRMRDIKMYPPYDSEGD